MVQLLTLFDGFDGMEDKSGSGKHIVLFDGECIVCNKVVYFLLRHDKKRMLRFGSLQSLVGREILRSHHLPETSLSTIVYVKNGIAYRESSAAIRILTELGGIFYVTYGLLAIPVFIRDAGYRLFSKCRYKLFGRMSSCPIPPKHVADRFI